MERDIESAVHASPPDLGHGGTDISQEMRHTLERLRHEVAAAERAKREFMANISHELRTPMNAILGFSQLLLKDPLEPQQQEKLRYIHAAGTWLMGVMNNVLEFSRLAAREVRLCCSPFVLDDVIHNVLADFQTPASEKGLVVNHHIVAGVPRALRGDRGRFRQILTHLVENAVKFTERGSIHVQVTLDQSTDQSATLRVVVSDTGVGVPADQQETIFEGFRQADGSSTRQFGGLGLGLAICRHLVELMGGQVGCRSSAGRGSSFWFTVPFQKQPAKPGDAPSRRAAPARESCAASGNAESGVQPPGLPPADQPAPSVMRRLEEHFPSVRNAMQQEDFGQLETCARSLRNAAQRAGARRVADHAMRIQLAARSRDPEEVTEAVQRLEKALAGIARKPRRAEKRNPVLAR